MATHAGKEGIVKIGANAVAEVTNWSYEETGDTSDTSSMDNTDGWKTHKHTQKEWSGNLSCWYDETDTNGKVALIIGTSVSVAFYPEGDVSTADYKSGTATVTKVTASASHDGIVEASFDFQGNGALTAATVA